MSEMKKEVRYAEDKPKSCKFKQFILKTQNSEIFNHKMMFLI